MQLNRKNGCHLTYCSNIHPGETWAEVRANMSRFVLPVKQKVSPSAPFGIGLRLSAEAAESLAAGDNLAEFKAFLEQHELYVFTINGFPFGRFHGVPVKSEVYLPDWRDSARLDYSNRLADLLAELLPPELAEGSVSTVPIGFKAEIATAEDLARASGQIIDHAAHLVALEALSGRHISLALEPEPCCHLETIEETVRFFESQLFTDAAARALKEKTGLTSGDAAAALRRHIGVCLDLCHAAVEFEDPKACLEDLRRAGIRIPKVQISAGLRCAHVDARTMELLQPFHDEVYLHQVVARNDNGFERFTDLPEAFDSFNAGDPGSGQSAEWRVHFHVPIFLDDLGEFDTTQDFIRDMLALHQAEAISEHMEVETYTWDVLPSAYRNVDVVDAVARELEWARERLQT